MQVEREVAKFLDENLYSKEIFTKHERTDTKDLQLKGSDIIISAPSLGIVDGICDELEVSSFQHGKLRDGWIINDSLDTTHYLFCWLSATKRWFGKDDIKWLEYALVRKADLIEYLESENLTKEHIIKNRDWILKNVHEKGAVGKNKHKDFYFYYSPQFVERPVNIIVKKDVYLNLSLLHGEIYNEKAK